MAYDASADAARIGQEATAGQSRPHAQGAGGGGGMGSMLSGGQFGKLFGGGGEAAGAGEALGGAALGGEAAAGGLAELAPLALLAL
jgi:hypothetical protein